jgi:pyruvate,water dikinase
MRAAPLRARFAAAAAIVRGEVDPDRILVVKPPLADSARVPVHDRTVGASARKIVYASGGSAHTVMV